MEGHEGYDGLGSWLDHIYFGFDIRIHRCARKYRVAAKHDWSCESKGENTYECKDGEARETVLQFLMNL